MWEWASRDKNCNKERERKKIRGGEMRKEKKLDEKEWKKMLLLLRKKEIWVIGNSQQERQ